MYSRPTVVNDKNEVVDLYETVNHKLNSGMHELTCQVRREDTGTDDLIL